MGVGGRSHAPAALLPGKYPDTNVTQSWAGLKGSLDDLEKKKNLLPLLALEPRTVQPGASHCGLV